MINYLKRICPRTIKKAYKNIKSIIKCRQYDSYKKKCKNLGYKEVILFCTPLHGNVGDQAITYAEEKLFQDNKILFFEVSTYEADLNFDYIHENIANDAVILIHGGGFLGSQWFEEEKMARKVIQNFKNHRVIILPQTIYYKNDSFGQEQFEKSKIIYNAHNDLHICARENISYEIMKIAYPHAEILLVPDTVLYLEAIQGRIEKNGILLCLREDAEAKLSKEEKQKIDKLASKFSNSILKTDMMVSHLVRKRNRGKEIKKKLKEFESAKLVVTDRLHGMIFACITNTPCITLNNYNHKVKGVYEWIKNLNYVKYIENVNDLEENMQTLLKLDNSNYDNTLLQPKYQQIIKLIKNGR